MKPVEILASKRISERIVYMDYKMTISEIVNGSYKVTEKQKLLNDLRKQFLEELENAHEEIKKGYKYCEKCKEFYKEKAWEHEVKQEMREVCTSYNWCEFDDPRYENQMCTVHYSICPMGHIIQESVTW